jgi:hypothetical protein
MLTRHVEPLRDGVATAALVATARATAAAAKGFRGADLENLCRSASNRFRVERERELERVIDTVY